MALTYTGTADSSKFAIVSAEVGYDVTGWTQRLEDEKFYKKDRQGRDIGFWSGWNEGVSLTINGEVNGDLDAIPPVKLAATGSITVANMFDMDTVTGGALYHDSSEVGQTQGASIATFSANATRKPSIA